MRTRTSVAEPRVTPDIPTRRPVGELFEHAWVNNLTRDIEFDDCPLQALLQRPGVQASVLALEALASGQCHAARLAQPLVGRAGDVIALAQLGPDAVFT